MAMNRSDDSVPTLSTKRQPVGVKRASDNKTIGEFAINDALLIVGFSWVALIVFYLSVRHVNV